MAHLTLDTATWDAADTLLGSRTSRKIGHNTTLHRNAPDDVLAVRYWHTDIVTMHRDGAVTVSVHGWTTVTTLQRVNTLLPGGWRIASNGKQGHWLYAAGWVPVTPYVDGLTVRPDTGAVEYPWGTPLLSADDVTAIRDAAADAAAVREVKRLARYADQHHRLRYAGGIVLRSADGFRHRYDCPQCTALRERERAVTRARLSAEHDAMAATLARNPTDAEPWTAAEYAAAGSHYTRGSAAFGGVRVGCPWDCPQRTGAY